MKILSKKFQFMRISMTSSKDLFSIAKFFCLSYGDQIRDHGAGASCAMIAPKLMGVKSVCCH